MKNNFLNKEVFSVVDFQKDYVGLIVCIYEFSQFYILFNEKKYNHDLKETIFLNYRKTTKFLKILIKKAEEELNFKIKKLFYNIDVNKLIIKKHEYFHVFSKPKKITEQDLEKLNKYFLKNIQKIENKEIIFSKINKYFLIDSNEIFVSIPMDKTINSIKLEGLVYYEDWQILFFYKNVFKKIKIEVLPPLLLPYAIYISLLFTKKNKNVIILNWKETGIQIFKFENRNLVDFLYLKNGINVFFEKIFNKFQYETHDVREYLYQIINLSKEENKIFDLYFELHDKKIKEIQDNLKFYFKEYVKSVFSEISEKFFQKKENENKDSVFFIVNEITNISGIHEFVQEVLKDFELKKHNPLFIGIKNYKDSFLIGNAYYHHLKNKIIYN